MTPAVSIGMPVYNEGRFLKPALVSLLAQDYTDFELVISDNASTDDTRIICETFASKDRRIRYVRSEKNQGAVRNFNRVFELSAGKYFMWAGGHDLWHPSFISRSIDVLEKESSVVLCYPLIACIDEEGRPMAVEPTRLDTRSMGVTSRLNCVIWGLNRCDLIYGLMRSEALRQTRLFRATLSPDNIIVAELSMVGSLAYLPEPLFFLRCARKNETYVEAALRGVATFYPPDQTPRFFFPSWRYVGEHLLAVFRASVPVARLPVLLASVFFGVLARRSKHMFHDLWLAAKALSPR